MDVIIYQDHTGDARSDCLQHCTNSIATHSPGSRIIVIGRGVKGMDFVPQDNFLTEYKKFLPHYSHHSPNSREFELICLRRWFVILEYTRTIEMDQFIQLDSDVLCFCDFRSLADEIRKATIWSPHASFTGIFDRHGLAMFCKAINWMYQHRESKAYKRLEDKYRAHSTCTGISDMTLMEWFMSTRKHLNLCDYTKRTDVIDTNICQTHDFMSDGDRKRLFFLNGYPYAVARDGRIVRMNTLHCWGPYKQKMSTIWQRSRESVGNPNPIPFTEQGQKKTSRFWQWLT